VKRGGQRPFGLPGVSQGRGVGSTVDRRSPKPDVGVRIPPPLPVLLAAEGGEKKRSLSAHQKIGRDLWPKR
jgi:hypothetical protein